MKLHKELKDKYQKLQTEASSRSDIEMQQKWTEAREMAQKEMEKRCDLQKQLSEVLERCQREQETNLTLLKQRATDQASILDLQRQVQQLKETLSKFESAADRERRHGQTWALFEKELQKLVQKTGELLWVCDVSYKRSDVDVAMRSAVLGDLEEGEEMLSVKSSDVLMAADVGRSDWMAATKRPRSSSDIRMSLACTSDSSCFPLQNRETPSPPKRGKKQCNRMREEKADKETPTVQHYFVDKKQRR